MLRPKQWLKNFFVFLPIFFSGELLTLPLLRETFYSFFAFCLMASAVYCINDIVDVEEDRRHIRKRNRPVASGKISARFAFFISFVLVIASFLVISIFSSVNVLVQMAVLLTYLILNVLYCFWLKKISVLDVMIIAVGFVLRLFMGGGAGDVELTSWIVIMTYLLTLFMAIAKRRDDLIIFKRSGINVRKNTTHYNLEFVNQMLCLLAAVTIVCYIMYTVSDEVIVRFNSKHLYLTTFFVLGGISRYLQLSIVEQKTGSPTEVLIRDRFVQFCIGFWIISFYVIIYL